MTSLADTIPIILSYKNKLLLVSPDIVVLNNSEIQFWRFLEVHPSKQKNIKELISREIFTATQLHLENLVAYTGTGDDNEFQFYHGKLTDGDVNRIDRRSGQRLEFFALPELKNLALTQSTNYILSHSRDHIRTLLSS